MVYLIYRRSSYLAINVADFAACDREGQEAALLQGLRADDDVLDDYSLALVLREPC